MYHLSTQYNNWLFTVKQLKEFRTKANNDYIQRSVSPMIKIIFNLFYSYFFLIRTVRIV